MGRGIQQQKGVFAMRSVSIIRMGTTNFGILEGMSIKEMAALACNRAIMDKDTEVFGLVDNVYSRKIDLYGARDMIVERIREEMKTVS